MVLENVSVFSAGFISSPHQAVGEHQHSGPVWYGGDQDEGLYSTVQGKQTAKKSQLTILLHLKFVLEHGPT